MSYIKTTLSGPGYRFVMNNYSFGRRGGKRGEKRERTKEEMEKQNARNRAIHTQLLILGNFRGGWHVILTYPKDDRPPDAEGGKKELRKFLERAGRRYKKAGYEFKWLSVTEIGSRGAVHHHLIIEDIQDAEFSSQRAIRESWKGGKYFTPMYEEGEYRSLSEYLVKKETKEDIPGCKVTHSRNLIMPKTKRVKRKGNIWPVDPRIPKGWELVKDSLFNGINVFTGLPSQQYLLIEIKENKNAGKNVPVLIDKEHPPCGRDRPVRIGNGDWRQGGYPPGKDPVQGKTGGKNRKGKGLR